MHSTISRVSNVRVDTLTPTNMAPDWWFLYEEPFLLGTLAQVLC